MTFEIPSVSELKHAAEDGQRITPADVSSISQAESELTGRGPGRAFHRAPGFGSVSSQVRSIANQNEVPDIPPIMADVPAYVTKDDAREAQRAESLFYGGAIPSGGMASQMQSAADKLEQARRGII
ncbi:hypothetical protein N7509_004405 [Penicillium cosmopolitanum]|uniref:SMP domain-containing protein n=1 Tax=Penicillium cosmopolitanum TaxID=1131564 RepID=A0A9X0BCE0_9EURO|nr:uncharacterized protein N7509_004405 [Penicillium cosmopolitanum]KAJ5404534.1 hypothetical protein N7509_004405 [Penicillium cosmopolitanum]